MAKNISVQEAVNRWQEAGFSKAQRYVSQASGKGGAWLRGASAAEGNFKEGVTKALSEGRFGKGVQSAGAGAYDSGIQRKGATNYSTGVAAGVEKMSRKITPFAQLWNQPLTTPRGAKGSASNLARMTDNVKRFQTAKK